MPPRFDTELPIDELLPEVRRILAAGDNLVVQAAPGAGKTTRLPLALLDEPWLKGRKILMQEPRRIATRAAARRMAETLGETVGGQIGYSVRLDRRIGPATRIEVLTDGIMLRRLQEDPALEDAGLVILDEFHERGLESDLVLALCRDAQRGLREDLRILVMSATLDTAGIAGLLDGAPVLTSEGRAFPVETRYLDRPAEGRIEDAVAACIRRALAREAGSLLVFLPGAREIGRVRRLLGEAGLPPDTDLAMLHGDMPPAGQDHAIRPAPAGRRKVVLATAIAETSLTIEGVRVVIDAGLMRLSRFDPASGMARLVTVRVSADAAEQRRGRAGRTEPGVCYRLWTEPEQRGLRARRPAEIHEADLSAFALELACWGAEPGALALPDQPAPAALAGARALLRRLGALDDAGRVTAHGRTMAGIGLHPRLAHMLLRSRELGLGDTGAVLAALLGERDPVRGSGADLRERLDWLVGSPDAEAEGSGPALRPIRELARRLGARARDGRTRVDRRMCGLLVAFAYPDRIARRRPGRDGEYLLALGRGAHLPPGDPLAAEEFLAVADLDGERERARIFRAAPLGEEEIEAHFGDLVEEQDEIRWDDRQGTVEARRVRRIGAVVLAARPLPAARAATGVAAALLAGVRQRGLACLPWTDAARAFQARVLFLRRVLGEDWPDISDVALDAELDQWLAPHLEGMTRLDHLGGLDLAALLAARLDWRQRRVLDELAPTHLAVPSGSRIAIDYTAPEGPVLAVRLQEMFGLRETPRVAGGQVALLLHLLSPAHRPVQVTRDLASFWASGYAQVKADLRGRYPRHHWPDDPLSAEPTSRVRRR
ncbi:MAG: ATP-dependent helicase HrpB [Alphaproteobacteria bacterium]|nr:ATP-dependent helicase HrpB [Alphaproteobacteria bacterium]